MDETTYIAIAQQQMSALYRMAYSIVGNRPDAEDALQQSFLNAWRHRAKARPGAERAWMMRILINECRSLLRRRKKTLPLEDASQLSAPEPAPDDGLRQAIRALPENLRTPLLLKYMEGMTEKEIAAALGLPQSSVKNRLFRARRKLKDQLNEEVGP